MDQPNNVIVFPKMASQPIVNPPTTLVFDPIENRMKLIDELDMIEGLTINLTGALIADLSDAIDVDDVELIQHKKQVAFLMESIRSLIMSLMKTQPAHPLSRFAEQNVEDRGDGLILKLEVPL
jgi:hypothetical protein